MILFLLERSPTPDNVTMFQGFEWNVPADQKHWKRLAGAIAGLKATGIDNIWIPPGCKASSPRGNGYDIYDLYDLGEFDQKGGVATKFGSKHDLLNMMAKANGVGMGIYWDAVLNHKAAADYTETCRVVEVDPKGAFCPFESFTESRQCYLTYVLISKVSKIVIR